MIKFVIVVRIYKLIYKPAAQDKQKQHQKAEKNFISLVTTEKEKDKNLTAKNAKKKIKANQSRFGNKGGKDISP